MAAAAEEVNRAVRVVYPGRPLAAESLESDAAAAVEPVQVSRILARAE
jgi:hypothetical protein